MSILQDTLYKEYLDKSNIPIRYKKDFALKVNDESQESIDKLKYIYKNIKNFIKDGNNLFLYSNITGNGKTSWACGLAKDYLKEYACNYDIECPVLFINVAEFLNEKKSSISSPELIDKIRKIEYNINVADVVIWDDLAVKGLSEYDSEQLYTYINYRVANMKANIFTANHRPENLENILGARIYSRVVNGSVCIQLVGADKRTF